MTTYDLYSAAGEYLETLPGSRRVDLPGKITIHNLDGLTDRALNAHNIYRREAVPVPVHNPLTHKVTTKLAIAGTKSRPTHTVVALPTAESDALGAEARLGAKLNIKREAQRRIEAAVPYWMVVAAVSGARTPSWTDVNALIGRAEQLISQASNATPDQLNAFNPRDDANWP